MSLSRRDLSLLLPMLAAAKVAAQPAQAAPLPSKIYHGGQMPYAGDEKKKGRRFFHGPTHTGFGLEVHETILGPGTATHAPHKHEHEEILIVFQGTLETSLEGKTELAETGSVIYLASHQMHHARNVGTTPCRYYVIELRGAEA